MSLSKNAIPQLVIQEADIPEGDNNYIEQTIYQDILVHVIEVPDLKNAAGIQSFIQTDSDVGKYNQVFQDVHQTAVDFPLFSGDYYPSSSKAIKNNKLNLDFDDFINNDDVLDSVQFINQQALVEGDSNNLDFYSEQSIYDLSVYDEFGFDRDYVFDETVTFDDFLENFASSSLLDSVQTGVQDVRVFGDDNEIIQELDQTIDTFIILDEDYSQELTKKHDSLSPVQFAFQESFLDNNDNLIDQKVHQNIEFDFDFSDRISDKLTGAKGTELSNPKFSIDDFVLPILDNNNEKSDLFENHEVIAAQKNQQAANVFGDENKDVKDNNQTLLISEGEIREVKIEDLDPTFEASIGDYFDGQKDFALNEKNSDLISDWLSDTSNSVSYI